MNPDWVFLPVLLQVLLTLALYIQLGRTKEVALANGEVDIDRRAIDEKAWPESVQKVNNCIRNQFESPILFYVLIFVLWLQSGVSLPVHALAWLYVVLRVAHAWVHTHGNVVKVRKRLFQISIFVIMVLAVLTAYAILV